MSAQQLFLVTFSAAAGVLLLWFVVAGVCVVFPRAGSVRVGVSLMAAGCHCMLSTVSSHSAQPVLVCKKEAALCVWLQCFTY